MLAVALLSLTKVALWIYLSLKSLNTFFTVGWSWLTLLLKTLSSIHLKRKIDMLLNKNA